jgi:predicted naringenin-chalcone synthase
MKKAYLTNFTIQRPEYELAQDEMTDWLIAAGQRSLKHQKNGNEREDTLPRIVKRFGVSSSLISNRGFYHKDFSLRDHKDMNIFSIETDKRGADLSVRGEDYLKITNEIFQKFYEKVESAPKNLIHVSCTGYVSPSAAQTLVSKKDWGNSTSVTHAYHMGCYAALPAVKMALGFNLIDGKKVDIINTELCSLHFNPEDYTPEKIIIHTLFADGAIKYSLKSDYENAAFEVINCKDVLVSDSLESMSWKISSHNFEMTLAKDVPEKIAKSLEGFVVNLLKESGMNYFDIKDQCIFAIHPGGPKIIDGIQDVLGLRDDQVQYSKAVLFEYGNMSSATLPHVWERVLKIEPDGKYVISLAFGPGLTIAGSFMKVVKR